MTTIPVAKTRPLSPRLAYCNRHDDDRSSPLSLSLEAQQRTMIVLVKSWWPAPLANQVGLCVIWLTTLRQLVVATARSPRACFELV